MYRPSADSLAMRIGRLFPSSWIRLSKLATRYAVLLNYNQLTLCSSALLTIRVPGLPVTMSIGLRTNTCVYPISTSITYPSGADLSHATRCWLGLNLSDVTSASSKSAFLLGGTCREPRSDGGGMGIPPGIAAALFAGAAAGRLIGAGDGATATGGDLSIPTPPALSGFLAIVINVSS